MTPYQHLHARSSMLALIIFGALELPPHARAADTAGWKAHTVHEGQATSTAVATDFTRDGKPDVISSSSGKVRLFIAPDWRETTIYTFLSNRLSCIHSTFLDMDGDTDLDLLIAGQRSANVVWYENPLR